MQLKPELEFYRAEDDPRFASPEGAEWGLFIFPPKVIGTSDRTFDTEQIRCIADNGRGDPDGVPATGWEHVSVSIVDRNDDFRLPAWTEMQRIKEVFWAPDETVLQYHPAESEYINVHGSVLHLWRPIDEALPTPPASAVGPAALGERPGTEPKR